MEAIARAAAAYLFLLLVFRICGRRTLARITSFELALLLVIGGAVQQASLHAGFTVLKRRRKGRRDRLRTGCPPASSRLCTKVVISGPPGVADSRR